MNVEDLYRLLRTSHVEAQGIVDTVTDPMLVLDGGLCVQSASRAFYEMFRVPRYETVGKHLYELGDGQWDIPELRHLLTEVIPKAAAVINYEVQHDFPGLGRRTMLLTARTLYDSDHASRSLLLMIVDATDRLKRDAAKDLLVGELRHRMKNMLGIAQSLARQTPTKGRTAEEYRDAFLGRFGALVEAQDLAFADQGQSGLAILSERILAPYVTDPEAVVIAPSPAIELEPSMAQSLSLVLHELATNAVKHGALSVPSGKVRISWQIEEADSNLRLTWLERGGPPVSSPATAGYGTELIRNATTYSLGGQVQQDYAPGGLKAEIVIPLGSASVPG